MIILIIVQVKAPRLLQSIFAAICDLYLFKLSDIIFGKPVAKWTVSFLKKQSYLQAHCVAWNASLLNVNTMEKIAYNCCNSNSPFVVNATFPCYVQWRLLENSLFNIVIQEFWNIYYINIILEN